MCTFVTEVSLELLGHSFTVPFLLSSKDSKNIGHSLTSDGSVCVEPLNIVSQELPVITNEADGDSFVFVGGNTGSSPYKKAYPV